MNLRPLGAQLLVKRAPVEKSTDSGIVLVEDGRQSIYADVLAIGPKVVSDIKVGDRVLLYGHQGKEVEFDGEQIVGILERDVEAVLE